MDALYSWHGVFVTNMARYYGVSRRRRNLASCFLNGFALFRLRYAFLFLKAPLFNRTGERKFENRYDGSIGRASNRICRFDEGRLSLVVLSVGNFLRRDGRGDDESRILLRALMRSSTIRNILAFLNRVGTLFPSRVIEMMAEFVFVYELRRYRN